MNERNIPYPDIRLLLNTVLSPLLDRLTAGILLVNDAGKVRLSNPAASRMLGIPGNKLFNQDFLPLIHGRRTGKRTSLSLSRFP